MNTKNESLFLSSLDDLKGSLNEDPVRLNNVKYQIDRLSKFSGKAELDYLNALLHPETERGVKIPSQIPIPSATFHLKSSFDLVTNESGCVFGHLHPFFLADDSLLDTKVNWYWPGSEEESEGYIVKFLTTLFVSNSASLNGTTQLVENLGNQNMGQVLPHGVYDQYRLVSASMRIMYTGSLDVASGVIGGAIVLGDRDNIFGARFQKDELDPDDDNYSTVGFGKEYTVFNRLRYAPYFRENSILEGLRMLYFPLDNSYNEFQAIVGKNHFLVGDNKVENIDRPLLQSDDMRDFGWYFYVQGGPAQKSFRLEMDCNFEVLPSAKVLNYMPISVFPENIDPKVIKQIYQEVMKSAIGKCLR